MRGQMRVICAVGHGNGTTKRYLDERLGDFDLQAAVGGNIEVVPYFDWVWDATKQQHVPCRVFCNEHGKVQGLHYNRTATELWKEALAHVYGALGTPDGDYLVGDVAIITGDDSFLADL